MKLMTWNKFFVFFMGLIFCSCNLSGKEIVPYLIDGSMVMDDSVDYEIAGLEYFFLNKSEKRIASFSIVFYVFDQDGNPPGIGKNNFVLTVNSTVDPGKSLNGILNLDSFLYEIPEVPYVIDYLYVSRIVYEDGTEWTDPFGLCVY